MQGLEDSTARARCSLALQRDGLLPPLRRVLLTRSIFAVYKKLLPAMSQTEREALEAIYRLKNLT